MKYYKIKYLLDLAMIIIFSPIIFILFILSSLLLIFFQGFPIFFISERVGVNYAKFRMIKFRTMKLNSIDLRNADGTTYNSKNDSRLTYLGKIFRKLSIDELPQLFNVIKGEMSIIGPRPDLPDQIKIYDQYKLSKERFKIRPGITGYAQINGRNAISIEKRTNLDNYYVHNMSFILDIKILFFTVYNVLFSKNINKNNAEVR